MAVTSASSYVIECEEASWRVIDRVTVPGGVTVEGTRGPSFIVAATCPQQRPLLFATVAEG